MLNIKTGIAQDYCITEIEGSEIVMDIKIICYKDNTVTLGDETSSVSYTASNRQNTAQIEETIKSLPSKSEILQEALRSAQDLINKQVASGYAIHTPNEFVVADDTEYKEKAKNLWRWGLGGLAHYSQGYDGPIDGVINNNMRCIKQSGWA